VCVCVCVCVNTINTITTDYCGHNYFRHEQSYVAYYNTLQLTTTEPRSDISLIGYRIYHSLNANP
jgi:hypothetical protein